MHYFCKDCIVLFWIFSNFVGMNNKIMTDTDYMKCFVKQVIDERWIKSIENCVAPWVEAKGKSYWDVVRIASIQNGTLNDMSRREFAELIFHLCPEVFGSNETANKIKLAMDKCPDTTKKKEKEYDTYDDNHPLKELVNEVKVLLEKDNDVEMGSKDILIERMYISLKKFVSNNGLQQLFRDKIYMPYVKPIFSIERYSTQDFMNQGRPTYIIAFEFIKEQLTPDKIHRFQGIYSKMNNIKLMLISTKPLIKETRILCDDFGFGFILLKEGEPIREKCVILPRSIGDIMSQRLGLEIIDGHRPMESPLLILDQSLCTSSLSEWLMRNNVDVSSEYSVNIPYISTSEIDALANNCSGVFTIQDAKDRWMSGNIAIDVFAIAKEKSISYTWDELPDGQLGRIDLINHHITLDFSLLEKEHCERFTMSHEIGHYVLHSNLPEQLGRIESFGDNNVLFDSTSTLNNVLNRCEIQANLFAASLLMPKFLVAYLYSYYFEINITRVYGDKISTLYWDDNNSASIQNCMRIIGPMARQLHVSIQAVKWRLKNMNLLKEGLSTSSILHRHRF